MSKIAGVLTKKLFDKHTSDGKEIWMRRKSKKDTGRLYRVTSFGPVPYISYKYIKKKVAAVEFDPYTYVSSTSDGYIDYDQLVRRKILEWYEYEQRNSTRNEKLYEYKKKKVTRYRNIPKYLNDAGKEVTIRDLRKYEYFVGKPALKEPKDFLGATIAEGSTVAAYFKNKLFIGVVSKIVDEEVHVDQIMGNTPKTIKKSKAKFDNKVTKIFNFTDLLIITNKTHLHNLLLYKLKA